MEAPDKIFAGTITEGIGVSKAWQRYPEHLENPIEYVRKNALLEWAKRELENAKITDFDEFGRGEAITWERVIDKINLL